MADRRSRERSLLDAILETPQENIDAYNEGIDYAMSDAPVGSAPYEYGAVEGSPGEAFWEGVEQGVARIQALVDALGEDED